MKLKEEGSDRSKWDIPDGVYVARCYGFVDVGTHQTTYGDDEPKDRHSGFLLWEIPSLRQKGEKDGKSYDYPKTTLLEYTLSLGPKANLRRDLQSWRGKDFTPEELNGFEIKSLIGATCQLQIGRNKNGNHKVNGVMALAGGMTAPDAEKKKVYHSFEDHSDLPENIPQFITDKIKVSGEWLALNGDSADDVKFNGPKRDSAEGLADDFSFPPEEKAEEDDNIEF